MKKRVLSLILCLALCFTLVASFAGCKKAEKPDAFVIMTEQLDGLFNPFFYTSANDGTIVGMTQIGMLGSKYEGGQVKVAYGDNEPVVAKDFAFASNEDGSVTYTFVLKNGIKFADGKPLTMKDVLFNYYVYLDPVYTGSNTLYSTKIKGLNEYRTQTIGADAEGGDSKINDIASSRAEARLMELYNLYRSLRDNTSEVSQADMENAIKSHSLSIGYKEAVSDKPDSVTNDSLLNDYKNVLEKFKKELNTDYKTAQESFHDAPYNAHEEFKDPIFCFMYLEGFVTTEYEKLANGKDDMSKIKKLTKNYGANIKDQNTAVNYVFDSMIAAKFDLVLLGSASAAEINSEYVAKAKEVYLHSTMEGDTLKVQNISGIVSLGHTDKAGSTVKVNGTDYKVATAYNADGTVKNADEYDVLQITIEGVDPKAQWNFAITVAPQHYYGEGSKVGVDIKNNKFGVEFASFDFMAKVVQSPRNVSLPMGAGVYKATNSANSDTPAQTEFFKDNVVYFKANTNFETLGSGIKNANIDKIRYKVVSSNDAIAALENGEVHYISPSLTAANYDKLDALKSKGYNMMSTDQLGYGYIGVNASKVKDINLRKAIMCAMNTGLAIDYYRSGTAERIFWNMSKVSWAFPDTEENGKDYPQFGKNWDEQGAIDKIKEYMAAAGVSAGDGSLKYTFTIAGATNDHPTYKVFLDAQKLLNSLGWQITVECDSQALTKISTGALDVWAAAWSSALDPDMYQVYHKDSAATSTRAWGYPSIKNSDNEEELDTLDKLSELIDKARETNDQAARKKLYQEAMGYVLDLAVELPVYQRDVLYAFNANVIDAETMPKEVNPYSSPLDRIWELKFVG